MLNLERKIQTVFLLMLMSAFSSQPLFAQGNAGQAGEFLRWGIGPKALGLGRAFTSVADDASAMYWNAAGLNAMARNGGSLMFMHIPLRNGASVNYLGGAIPLRLFFLHKAPTGAFFSALQNLNLGLGVLWHSLGSFQFFDADGQASGDQSANTIGASAVYLSAAYPLNALFKGLSGEGPLTGSNFLKGTFSVGLTAKWIHQDVFGFGGSATSFDLGFRYSHYSDLFHFGFSWRDIGGPSIEYSENISSDALPEYGVLGVSLTPPVGPLRGLLLSFDYGVIKPGGRDRDLMFGVEYDLSVVNPAMPVKLRLGANSNQEALTVGINFSPESVLGNDWLPHGDVTYANQRSAFDASGERFAISIDKNPFTARYWYMNAAAVLNQLQSFTSFDDGRSQEVLTYLKNAERAKNPGKRAYRYEAALRRADVAFFSSLSDYVQMTDRQEFRHKSGESFRRVSRLYIKRASRFLRLDKGKAEVDRGAYVNSFLLALQSEILSGAEKQAAALCDNRGQAWGLQQDMLRVAEDESTSARLDYLHAYALYKQGKFTEAVDLIERKLPDYPIAGFLKAHIAFLRADYEEALRSVARIELSKTRFPDKIFLPVTRDETFGDELLFIAAACRFELASDPLTSDYLDVLVNILRFFPRSGMAKFLAGNHGLLAQLIDYHAQKQTDKIVSLFKKMIQSYLDAFSGGALQVETYTINYR